MDGKALVLSLFLVIAAGIGFYLRDNPPESDYDAGTANFSVPWPMFRQNIYRSGGPAPPEFAGLSPSPVMSYGSSPPEGCVINCFLDENDTISSSPIFLDFDGDGREEVVAYFKEGFDYVMGTKWYEESKHPNFRWVWKLDLADQVHTSFAAVKIGSGFLILFGSDDGNLYAIDENGKQKWKFQAEGKIRSSPAIAKNKNNLLITFGSDDGNLYAIDGEGRLLWKFQAEGKIRSSPAIAKNKNNLLITFGSDDGNLYAIDENGKQKWKFQAGDKVRSSPLVFEWAGDGSQQIVFGSDDGKVYVIDMEGFVLREYETGGRVRSSAAAYFKNGSAYAVVGSENGVLYFLGREDAFGVNMSAPVVTTPVSVLYQNNPMVLVAGADGRVLLVDKSNFLLLKSFQKNFTAFSSPALGDLNSDGKADIVIQATLWEGNVSYHALWAMPTTEN